MKLDPRIIDVNKIFSIINSEKAAEYIGETGYFTSNYMLLGDDVDDCIFADLKDINDNHDDSPFLASNNLYYMYFIPVQNVKEKEEKKYRAYTIGEFQRIFKIGHPVRYRIKGQSNTEKLLIFNGYERNNNKVYIYFGNYSYTLEQLFEAFEWQEYYTDDYQPFGIKDEV